MDVRFVATAPGSYEATVDIRTDLDERPSSVELVGEVEEGPVAPSLVAIPDELVDFGTVFPDPDEQPSESVGLANEGDGPAVLEEVFMDEGGAFWTWCQRAPARRRTSTVSWTKLRS